MLVLLMVKLLQVGPSGWRLAGLSCWLPFFSGRRGGIANAFQSVTMHDGKTQLLIKNPINRYLINSPTLPDMKKNDDGSSTLLV
jgi:hypothetical protein